MLERQLAEFEPPEEVSERWRAELQTEARPAQLVADLEAIVDARVWGGGAGQAG